MVVDDRKKVKEILEAVVDIIDKPDLNGVLKDISITHNCSPEALRAMLKKFLKNNVLRQELNTKFHPYA